MKFTEPSGKDRIIVALDVNTLGEVEHWVGLLAPYVGAFKIGLQLMHRVGGPTVAETVHRRGGQVMYDAKLHDIPETMGLTSKAIADLGVMGFTIHACSGFSGIHAAHQFAGKSLAIGVTVLTSHDTEECVSIFGAEPERKVLQFAGWLADEARTDDRAMGIVCSPKEVASIRAQSNLLGLVVITPGVRPLWYGKKDDQKRVATPAAAIRDGANAIVIGRPLLHPPPEVGTPVDAAKRIAEEIKNALQRQSA